MPIDKSMTKSEIIKKEIAAGKPQDQAVAIAYSVKGENEKKNEARDRFDSMQMRAQRGTERYASKKKEKVNIDEASEDEKEEQFDELQRKRDQNY